MGDFTIWARVRAAGPAFEAFVIAVPLTATSRDPPSALVASFSLRDEAFEVFPELVRRMQLALGERGDRVLSIDIDRAPIERPS